jgi:hypothetical protein
MLRPFTGAWPVVAMESFLPIVSRDNLKRERRVQR